jgi:cobalt-zinc-cadmium efflux system outer membrane protein
MLTSSLLASVFVLLAAPALPTPVGFDEAIGIAARAPEVVGAERAAIAKKKSIDDLSVFTENPELILEPGVRLAPSTERGFEGQARLTESWNLAGLASKREIAGKLEEKAFSAEARARALTARLGAARTWIDLWAAERQRAHAIEEASLAAELTALVEKGAVATLFTRADVADARAYQAEAELNVISTEGAVYEISIALSREMARDKPGPMIARGDLPDPALPSAEAVESELSSIARLPNVEGKRLLAEAERARAVEERAMRGTKLTLGVAAARDQPGGFSVFGVAGMSLPIFEHGGREAGSSEARAADFDGQRERAAADARSEVALDQHEVEHTGEVLAALDTRLVPAMDAGRSAREALFKQGEATVLEVLQSRRASVNVKSRLERARADASWAKVKLWMILAADRNLAKKDAR